ncbi:hypothetical protein D3C84_1014160 [compost metagenome]
MNRLRDVALATTSASMRIFFIRASGAKGLPLTIPMAAIGPINSGSRLVAGSCCTTSFNISKYEKSFGGMVFITLPLPSWNAVGGGGVTALSLALPAKNSAIGVPTPPAL